MESQPLSQPPVDIQTQLELAAAHPEHGQTKTRACDSCTRRKIKCDKLQPRCSACIKSMVTCQCTVPERGQRKRKAVSEIHERLDKYERILDRHGLLSETKMAPAEIETVINPFLQPQIVSDTTRAKQYVDGPKTEFQESDLWTRMRDALKSAPSQMKDASDKDLGSEAALASAALCGDMSLFTPSLTGYHPTYEVAMKLWKLYRSNVDPVVKCLHMPTVGKMIEQVAANPGVCLDKEAECLTFAIYHIAIITASESEVQNIFGQDHTISAKLREALRISLISCQYYKTSSLKVLQAFVLFLMSIKSRSDPDTLWTLIGNAVRIAQRMQLHRDGTNLGLNPYETEMRRRLWWTMIPLDASTGRLCGVGGGPVLPSFWDTKRPLNINDDDISPQSTVAPEPRQTATDMIFCLVKMEIGGFHHKVRHRVGGWFRETDSEGLLQFEQALQTVKTIIEEKYIRYCDITLPIHYFTVAMARAALDYGELQLRLQQEKESMTPSQKKAAFTLALRILDHDIACTLNPAISRFSWFRADFMQWGPLIWIFNELSRGQRDVTETESAWEKIEQIYNCHSELLALRRSIDLALGRLALAAWDASQEVITIEKTPAYISSLRTSLAPQNSHSILSGTIQPPNSDWMNSTTSGPLDALNIDSDWQFWEQFIRESGNSQMLNF